MLLEQMGLPPTPHTPSCSITDTFFSWLKWIETIYVNCYVKWRLLLANSHTDRAQHWTSRWALRLDTYREDTVTRPAGAVVCDFHTIDIHLHLIVTFRHLSETSESESESESLLSQYRFTRKFVLRYTVRDIINNNNLTRLQRLKIHETHNRLFSQH